VIALVAALLLASEPSHLVSRSTWSQLPATEGQILAPTADRPFEALRVVNDSGRPRRFTVAVVERPDIRQTHWVVSGRVRYESVQGHGYLEMWSHLGSGAYFTRTLGATGPMQWLSGTSVWREFTLPFDARGTKLHPEKLVVNVVLPGRGSVELSPLAVYDGWAGAETGPSGLRDAAWWGERQSGWVGGIAGTVFGILGAMIGGFLAQGRARGFVRSVLVAEVGLGVTLLAAGLLAFTGHQPYAVWYPLVLFGGFLCLWAPYFLRLSARRYREAELRKMAALDIAR
jgi:hypothetical protein